MAKRGGKQPGAGKPKKIISAEEMEKAGRLAKTQVHIDTIEKILGWGKDFIAKRQDISEFIQQKRAEGRAELAEIQYSMAKNPTMAIWLGKQHLGQADKQDQHHIFEEIKLAI